MAATIAEIQSCLNSFMHIFAHVHRKVWTGFSRNGLPTDFTHPSLLVRVRIQDPCQKRKSPIPTKILFYIFLVFVFVCRNTVLRAACFFSFSLMNIMRYISKTCSSWRTIFLLLSAEGSEWRILYIGKTPQICETAKYEPRKKRGMSVFHPDLQFCHLRRVAQTIWRAGWPINRGSIPTASKTGSGTYPDAYTFVRRYGGPTWSWSQIFMWCRG